MPVLSDPMQDAIYNPETQEIILPLLTISHDSLPEPYRFVANTEAITSRGNEYTPLAFRFTLPDNVNSEITGMAVEFDNVDLLGGKLLRQIQEPFDITLELVLSSNPDVVEIVYDKLTLRSGSYDVMTASFDLGYKNFEGRKFPKDSFTPDKFPGLFG